MSNTIDLSKYHLTFDDEFNGSSLNTTTWGTSFGQGAVRTLTGNGEQEAYVEPAFKGLGLNPFSLSNGVLTISANPTPPSLSSAVGEPYTSGMITTQQSWSQEYGYFEMKAQLPAGDGLWPAFWMLPVSNNNGQEIDVFEQLGKDPGTVYQTVHYPNGGQMFDAAVPSSSGEHTYGVGWTPTTMTFYVDGLATGSIANPINQPMYMIANLAVGGTWPGYPDTSTQFPAQMKIDYIRAYSTDPNIPSVGTGGGFGGGGISNGGTIGTGADKLVLNISEDRYANGDGTSDTNGDSTFVILVDGKQIGGTLTATAMHAQGQTEPFTVLGNFGPGNHLVEARLTNDAWSGVSSPTTDRNIYVDRVTYNGAAIAYTGKDVNGAGASFTISGGTPPPSDDTLVLNLSADLYQGSPQFIVSVDGKQQGGPQSVTALHSAGQTQAFDFTGAFGSGPHDIAVSFINDAWGGTSQTDRNLYVNSIDYDGQHYGSDSASLFSNGTVHFTVG